MSEKWKSKAGIDYVNACKKDGALSCNATATGSVSLVELEELMNELSYFEAKQPQNDIERGCNDGIGHAIDAITDLINQKKQND
jgi:hypothetical protein